MATAPVSATLTHEVALDRAAGPALDAFLEPRTVAIIGATDAPGSVGRSLLRNLTAGPFGGVVYPVNPRRTDVLGIKAYPTIGDVCGPVDLAVIATPAAVVPGVVEQCAAAHVRGAVIISAGFREAGPQGVELERQILQCARRGPMRIVGPNCLGVMNPLNGLNATFARRAALPGDVAILSQSGALLTSILDWSLRERVGFSAVVSTGSMLDVSWADWIDYLGNDPRTRSILIYMESVGDQGRAFLSAARAVSLAKPIIVMKAGRTPAAAQAAASHTGAMTGSDDVLDAVFRRAGVLRVDTLADLFAMADVLAKQPRPPGPRLAIVTNAGGPGVIAADALLASGGELATLADETLRALDAACPPAWSHANPVDVLGDATPERFAAAAATTAADAGNGGLLVILTPQDMTDPTRTADAMTALARLPQHKPVLASWMGGAEVAAGRAVLSAAGIPTFDFPDEAARAFGYMWRYTYNLRGLYETPAMPPSDEDSAGRESAARLMAAARDAGRETLTGAEAMELLTGYGIPTVPTSVARTATEAAKAADALGYPVALKLLSRTITHKTDVGGVKLNLSDRQQVVAAFAEIEQSVTLAAGREHFEGVIAQRMVDREGRYEIILGSCPDPQFGPVMLFGAGGQLVETFRDHSLGLPPLNATLARRMMEQTRIFAALRGVRGRPPVDLAQLDGLLVRFSQMVIEQPWLREVEINPLLVSAGGIVAVDARATLWPRTTAAADLPRPAIRPYPVQYVTHWELGDGTSVLVRPIRPEDEPLVARFHAGLSEETVRNRYFGAASLSYRAAHERLTRTCFADYDRDLAFVAEARDAGERPVILGIARLSRRPNRREEAEFALVIADDWQHRGLGRRLLDWLIDVAGREGIKRLSGMMLPGNSVMQRLAGRCGLSIRRSLANGDVIATRDL